jgi:hypothetical protein
MSIGLSTSAPLFFKEGLGEILESVIKIPLYPPLQMGNLEGKFLKSTTLNFYQQKNKCGAPKRSCSSS